MISHPASADPSANRLLALLPKDDFERLSGSLRPTPLVVKHVLYRVRAPIDFVYFPIGGVISAMTIMEDGSAIEVATIGKEGMAGLTAFMGDETSPHEVMVQVVGQALRMPVDDFQREAMKEGPFRALLFRYNTAFAMQVSFAVACNGLHKIEQRCARWLLMTQDRVGSNMLPLTHEFLSIMLGVRRASVTDVLNLLEERALIRNSRGQVEVLDRPGLEKTACECHRRTNEEFARLFG